VVGIPVKVNQNFRKTCCLHHQVQKEISQTRNQHESGSGCYLLHSGFLLGLLFNPEGGGAMFLQNVG
jgi:hypothetical protein